MFRIVKSCIFSIGVVLTLSSCVSSVIDPSKPRHVGGGQYEPWSNDYVCSFASCSYDRTKWENVYPFTLWVTEAKKRGLSCLIKGAPKNYMPKELAKVSNTCVAK